MKICVKNNCFMQLKMHYVQNMFVEVQLYKIDILLPLYLKNKSTMLCSNFKTSVNIKKYREIVLTVDFVNCIQQNNRFYFDVCSVYSHDYD